MPPWGEVKVMRRAGFTLIEILVVVGIIAIMLAGAVMSIASGRGAVKAREASRGVIQLSRYASSLALLRQRPVVVTFHHEGRIDVRISGEATSKGGGSGDLADPIYREVDGETVLSAAEYLGEIEEEETAPRAKRTPAVRRKTSSSSAKSAESSGGRGDEEKGFFYTRRVLDPETLAQEDAEGKYSGVTFTVEVLGEDGEPLAPEEAAQRSLRQPERTKPQKEGEDEEDAEAEPIAPPVSVTYETNGNVTPHRVTVRLSGEDETSEGFTISISRTGKASVEDAEEESGGRRRNARRRR